MNVIKNNGKAMRFAIAKVMETSRKYLFVLLGAVFCKVLTLLLVSILPSKLIDFLTSGEVKKGFIIAGGFCVIVLANEMVSALAEGEVSKLAAAVYVDFGSKLGTAVMESEYERIERKSFLNEVEFAKKCMDRNSIVEIYRKTIEMASGIFQLISVFFIVSALGVEIKALIVIAVVVSTLGEIFRLHYVYERNSQGNEIERNLYYARNELVRNKFAKDIRVWNLYDYVSGKVQYYARELCKLWSRASMKSVKVIGWTYLVNGAQYVITYVLLAYMAYQKELSLSDFVLYLSAVTVLSASVKMIFASYVEIGAEYQYVAAVETLLEKGKKEETVTAGSCVRGFAQKIEFIDVWYRYYGADDYVIKGLCLTIERGRIYSLVGRNGAGKTTMIKLLLGLYRPERGKILIDGVPIDKMDPSHYRQLFSCVFQDFSIYGFSVGENVAFSRFEEKDRIWEALKRANLGQVVSSLPFGMDTLLHKELNENAAGLSGGQEQLIAIARSLFKEADFYVWDEPTAALSPNSEWRLYEQLKEISTGKTVLFISHRMASCLLSDEIIVLEDGRVVEKGSHEALMRDGGLYSRMFMAQSEPYWREREVEGDEARCEKDDVDPEYFFAESQV